MPGSGNERLPDQACQRGRPGGGTRKWLPKETLDDESVRETDPGQSPAEAEQALTSWDGVFDRAALLRRVAGDEELMQEILETFLDDMPGQLEALRGHLDAADVQAAKHRAHTIKGASASIGGDGMHRVASLLEQAAIAEDASAANALLPQLEVELERLKAAVGRG